MGRNSRGARSELAVPIADGRLRAIGRRGTTLLGLAASLGLMACGAEPITPRHRASIAGAGEISDEGLFPNARWDPAVAFRALESGTGTLHYRGLIEPGLPWVDPDGWGEISIDAQLALVTAPTFWAVPPAAVPLDIGQSARQTLVALAFTDEHGEVWLQPGLRDGRLGFETAEPARLIIAGRKKDGDGDTDGPDSNFDATDEAPDTSAEDQWDVEDTSSGNDDADLWEATEDETPDPESEGDPDPYVVEVETDEDLMKDIEEGANERDKKKMN